MLGQWANGYELWLKWAELLGGGTEKNLDSWISLGSAPIFHRKGKSTHYNLWERGKLTVKARVVLTNKNTYCVGTREHAC